MPTFLLDLDNTLLTNDMRRFLPPYIEMLSARLAPYAAGKDVARELVATVQAVVANADAVRVNLERFMAGFTARLGCSADEITAAMTHFFAEDYPRLRQFTAPRPAAPRLVRRLLEMGCRVVVATNPLFPATAIEQRLAWAGVADFPFARVTTMENSRFAKPDPRYYQEILEAVGAVAGQCWMVGDDPQNDIIPAAGLGMKTWLITDSGRSPLSSTGPATCHGSLDDLLTWLERQDSTTVEQSCRYDTTTRKNLNDD